MRSRLRGRAPRSQDGVLGAAGHGLPPSAPAESVRGAVVGPGRAPLRRHGCGASRSRLAFVACSSDASAAHVATVRRGGRGGAWPASCSLLQAAVVVLVVGRSRPWLAYVQIAGRRRRREAAERDDSASPHTRRRLPGRARRALDDPDPPAVLQPLRRAGAGRHRHRLRRRDDRRTAPGTPTPTPTEIGRALPRHDRPRRCAGEHVHRDLHRHARAVGARGRARCATRPAGWSRWCRSGCTVDRGRRASCAAQLPAARWRSRCSRSLVAALGALAGSAGGCGGTTHGLGAGRAVADVRLLRRGAALGARGAAAARPRRAGAAGQRRGPPAARPARRRSPGAASTSSGCPASWWRRSAGRTRSPTRCT